MAFAAPMNYAPTVIGASGFGGYGGYGGYPAYDATSFGYNAAPVYGYDTPLMAPAQVVSAVPQVQAAPTVTYTQSAVPVGPGYPVNLREGDFWNPAANTVFDRLVGTQAGKGALYNNEKKRGISQLLAKRQNPEVRPSYGDVAAPGPAPGPAPVLAPAPVFGGPIVAPGPGPVVVPPTANTVYQPSPYGYGPVATPNPQPAVAYNKKGKPVKAKKGKAPVSTLPTLSQVEALDVMRYRQPIIGAPVPAGPPMIVSQEAFPSYPAAFAGAYPAF